MAPACGADFGRELQIQGDGRPGDDEGGKAYDDGNPPNDKLQKPSRLC